MKLTKTDSEGFYKDMNTGAVINHNKAALENYKARKKEAYKMEMMENKINNMENQLSEIRSMLRKLTDG